MKIQFQPLIDVEILHNYYASKRIPDLEIIPTRACRQLLRNYGLLFRKKNNGFTVQYEVIDSGNGNPHPQKPITESTRFSFTLQSKNPYLVSFSDLPFVAPSNRIYYLSNLNNNPQNSSLLLTSKTSSPFLTTQDSLELQPLRFDYRATSADTSALIEIKDEWSETVIARMRPVVSGKLHYLVDLRTHGPGKFTLFLNGIQKKEFYASNEIVGKNIFGLVDIVRDDRVPDAYQITDPHNNHDVLAKTFTVKINNRETWWKYNVVLKYRRETKPEDLSIAFFTLPENGDSPGDSAAPETDAPTTTFERKSKFAMPDGLTAVPFVAQDGLPLVEKPLKRIQLVKTGSGDNGMFTIDNLTNPSLAAITADEHGKLYSEIYVYI